MRSDIDEHQVSVLRTFVPHFAWEMRGGAYRLLRSVVDARIMALYKQDEKADGCTERLQALSDATQTDVPTYVMQKACRDTTWQFDDARKAFLELSKQFWCTSPVCDDTAAVKRILENHNHRLQKRRHDLAVFIYEHEHEVDQEESEEREQALLREHHVIKYLLAHMERYVDVDVEQ